jgi:CBS domain-containing protein
MLSERIGHSLQSEMLVTAPPRASVLEAAELMLRHGVGAVLVVEDDLLVGIFTERDAVFRVLAPGRDPRVVRLEQVMTRQPVTVGPEATFGYAMLLMLEHGFRRLPVLEDGRPIGLVTARNALDPELEDFISEEHRREALARSGGGSED